MPICDTILYKRFKFADINTSDKLYKQYKPKLLSVCKHYAREDDVAEDLLHDAFVIIFTSLDKLEDPDKLEAWMTSIVRNVGYQYRQHINKEQSALQQLAQDNHETTEVNITPDYDQLKSLVAQLPQGYQQVFKLSVFEGLSHQEISQLLGIAPHSSSSQLFHAKQMLRHLIRKSWILVLLLVAIPTAIWLFRQKEETKTIEEKTQIVQKKLEKPQDTKISLPTDSPHRNIVKVSSDSISHPQQITHVVPQAETIQETDAQTVADTVKTEQYHDRITNPTYEPEPQLMAQAKTNSPWHISMTVSGFTGGSSDYLTPSVIGQAYTLNDNMQILNRWIDNNNYLNNLLTSSSDAEARSLMNIANQNIACDGGMMDAHYEHKLPFTVQILLNRQLSRQLSVETGLSYTLLHSTIKTGSTQAYIEGKQHLHYLGIPVRVNWQWLSKSHLSLYTSAGAMFELPVHSTFDVTHMWNGQNTFGKSTSLDVPCQWSTSFGVGLQYDFTPHLGIYLEPTLQYFFKDGSDIKTYRTEHPIQITLPLGIRFHW